MKTILLSLTLTLLFSASYGQQTANQLLQTEFIRILQSDGILLKDNEKACTGDCRSMNLWKNDNKKEKWLKKDEKLKNRLLNKFSVPSFCENKIIKNELVFKDKTIGLIGSYFIRNKDFSVINSNTKTDLPVIQNGNQLSIFSPKDDGSNYVLNYTSTKLFEGGVDANVDADFKEYFNLKLQTNTNLSNQDRSQISIGAGKFENQLGVIFDKVVNGQLSATEFEPVYYLWLEYKKGNIKPTDKVIYSFDGLCFFSSKGVEKKEEEKFTSELNSSGKYPFLSYGLKASAKWSNSSSFTSQRNIYNVFMFSEPTLTGVPTIADILKNWNNLTPNNSITFPSTNNIPLNSPMIATVVFGPIPNTEIFPLIKLDEKFSLSKLPNDKKFVKNIKLINDPSRIKPEREGYYTFEIEFYRDEKFLSQNINSIGDIISAELPIRIFIDNPIGNDTLDKIYDNIEIKTERFPVPTISEYELIPIKSDNSFKYSATVKFNTTNSLNVSNSPRPPKISEVYGLPNAVDENIRKNLRASSFSLKGNNEFTFTFTFPEKANYFDINQRSYDIDIVVDFIASNGVSYLRKIPVRLIGPKEMIDASNQTASILINDNGQLLEALDKKAFVSEQKTVQDFINSNTKQDKTFDVLSFVDDLKKNNKLSVSPDNKYFVPAILIDQSKLKK